jgi:hypothetical protein
LCLDIYQCPQFSRILSGPQTAKTAALPIFHLKPACQDHPHPSHKKGRRIAPAAFLVMLLEKL